jgi:hypothetical protein
MYYYTNYSKPLIRIGITTSTDDLLDGVRQAKKLEETADKIYSDISNVALSFCFVDGLMAQLDGSENKSKRHALPKTKSGILVVGDMCNITSEQVIKWMKDISKLLKLNIRTIVEENKRNLQMFLNKEREITQGYIIFLLSGIDTINEITSFIGKDGVILISIEPGKSGIEIMNIYSPDPGSIVEFINKLKSRKLIEKCIISIAKSTDEYPIYKIQDCPTCTCVKDSCQIRDSLSQCKDWGEYQLQNTFIRFISHIQNIASRLLTGKGAGEKDLWFFKNYGSVYSSDNEIITKIGDLENKTIHKLETQLKGLGGVTVYKIH